MFVIVLLLHDILAKFHLDQNVLEHLEFDQYQRKVADSHLVERMHATREAIHSQAGQRLIYEEVYVQPNKSVCKYVYTKHGVEFHMSMAIQSAGPTVTFSCSKAKYWIEGILHPFGHHMDERRSSVKCKLLIDPETVTDTDLERWFSYLLSELRQAFKPGRTIPPHRI